MKTLSRPFPTAAPAADRRRPVLDQPQQPLCAIRRGAGMSVLLDEMASACISAGAMVGTQDIGRAFEHLCKGTGGSHTASLRPRIDAKPCKPARPRNTDVK